jgi:PAS domain S-box-containing protein
MKSVEGDATTGFPEEGSVSVVLVTGDADDAALGGELEDALGATVAASVEVTAGVEAIESHFESVDCVVCAAETSVVGVQSVLDCIASSDADVPVIAFASIDDVDVSKALSAGVTDVVPVNGTDAVSVLADRVLRAVAAVRVRERSRTQAADLRAERDRFAALFENIPEPTVFYEIENGEPVTIDVNPAFESVFGYAAATVRGDVVDDYIVPEDRRAEATELNDQIARGISLDREVTRSTAGGDREFLLRDVPLPESDGMRGYAIYTDITTQRERETELRETTARLEEHNERLEAFTGVVSHDLRNPLSVAMTYTEILAERYADDEDIETVTEALDRMDGLVEDLLALAQQGSDARDTRLLEIETVARDAWRVVDTTNATLEVDVEGAAVRADESRLRQLFENLYANSIEHGRPTDSDGSVSSAPGATVDGGTDDVTVSVGVIGGVDGDGFYVADDGPGIEPDVEDRIFEQGFTGAGGTGFGLAIVEAVVDAHGWAISVTNGTDGGARFEVTDVDLVI